MHNHIVYNYIYVFKLCMDIVYNSAYVDHPKCSVFRFKDASVSAVSDIHLATDDSHILVVGAQGFSLYEYVHGTQKQMGNMALKLVYHSIVYCNKCVQDYLCTAQHPACSHAVTCTTVESL